MDSSFDIWYMLAWLAILLFGLFTFEESIKKIWWDTLKRILQFHTKTKARSILLWTTATGLLQSSSLVSMILLTFVGAGILPVANAVWVLVGTNVGSTLSSVLVAILGFGDVSIAAFAFPILVLGAAIMVGARKEKTVFTGKLLVWFGLLFLGLDFMKESVSTLQDSFSLTDYTGSSLIMFFVIGAIFTAIVQSSSAMGLIALTTLAAWVIDFPTTVAIMMWANIGTTITPILASIGWTAIKRQLVFFHLLFNIALSIIGGIFFWQFIRVTTDLIGITDNYVVASAVTNLLFNVVTAIALYPLIGKLTQLVTWLIPDTTSTKTTQSDDTLTVLWEDIPSISLVMDTLPQQEHEVANEIATPAQIAAMIQDTETIIQAADNLHQMIRWDTAPAKDTEHHEYIIKQYYAIHSAISTLLKYYQTIAQHPLSEDEQTQLQHIYTSLSNTLTSIKYIKNNIHTLDTLRHAEDKKTQWLYKKIKTTYQDIYTALQKKPTTTNDQMTTRHDVMTKHMLPSTASAQVTISALLNLHHALTSALEHKTIALQHLHEIKKA